MAHNSFLDHPILEHNWQKYKTGDFFAASATDYFFRWKNEETSFVIINLEHWLSFGLIEKKKKKDLKSKMATGWQLEFFDMTYLKNIS